MALGIARLTARVAALTDAAALIETHDAGTWEEDPEFHEILMEERKKVSLMLIEKAKKLRGNRELLDFECD